VPKFEKALDDIVAGRIKTPKDFKKIVVSHDNGSEFYLKSENHKVCLFDHFAIYGDPMALDHESDTKVTPKKYFEKKKVIMKSLNMEIDKDNICITNHRANKSYEHILAKHLSFLIQIGRIDFGDSLLED